MALRLVDANCALGTYARQELEFSEARDLIRQMDSYGIDQALVYHLLSVSSDAPAGNAALAEEAGGHPGRLLQCWVMVPEMSWAKGSDTLLGDMHSGGVKAVRLYPRSHGFTLAQWNLDRLLGAFNEAKIIACIDADELNMDDFQRTCSRYPDIAFVVTNPSYYSQRALYPIMALHANVHVEISTYLAFGGLDDLVMRFGAERVLFGTRMPFNDPGGAIAAVAYATASDHQRELIAGGNLARLARRVLL